jgi:predicted dehydrogenase
MANRMRMIVVGAGRGRAHLRSFLALPDVFEVVGVVDLDEDRLDNVLSEFKLESARGFTSYEKALTESGCDGVMIATWARTHGALAKPALDAGRHLLLEKPFSLDIREAKDLLDVAEERNLKIVVIQQWRFLPGLRTFRRLLSSGVFGEPQVGHMASYKARGGEYPDSPHSQLWQMTVHEIDALIAIMNQPVVEVFGHSYRPPETTWKRESTVTAELTFQNGCRVVMVSTSDARVNSMEVRVECENAALIYQNTGSFGGTESLWGSKKGESELVPLPLDDGPKEPTMLDRHIAGAFADWVNGGPEPETSGRNNLQVLGTLDALLRSGSSGKAEKVAL